ncbi:MAG: leucyl/phenylalanyl-tRNA--protein transferase, partial [Paracoccaceae bacterium]
VARLNAGGFALLDTQFLNDHLATMGGIEISRHEFREKLGRALEKEPDFWKLSADTSPYRLWQLSTQTS